MEVAVELEEVEMPPCARLGDVDRARLGGVRTRERLSGGKSRSMSRRVSASSKRVSTSFHGVPASPRAKVNTSYCCTVTKGAAPTPGTDIRASGFR